MARINERIVKAASVICTTAFVWQVGIASAFAAESAPPQPDAGRPVAAAIATAGQHYGRLLSQAGTTPISRKRGLQIGLGAGVGFGVGYGMYYFENKPLDHPDEKAHALASGTIGALIGGVIVYALTTL